MQICSTEDTKRKKRAAQAKRLANLRALTREQCNRLYMDVLRAKNRNEQRWYCKYDLFYLLTVGCNRRDIDDDWLFARCREVELDPDGHLDLWSREHYKSTIITYGKTMQDILCNPDITVGIFSFNAKIAKAFLRQIKVEFEQNEYLKGLFDDILWKDKAEARRNASWSEDKGICVKRKTNPKEQTIEASGLVDGQPTSKHYSLLVYDDVVTKESVYTPAQIENTTDSWALSLNLGAHGGKRRYIGTRYHFNDTYATMMKRQAAVPRIHAATADGSMEGSPVFLHPRALEEKRREMGSYVFGCQMLQNPKADSAMGFKEEWLRYYDKPTRIPYDWNLYLLVDPAGEKKKDNDYTVMMVVGLAPDNNYYLIDAVRDRMNLTEKARCLFRLHKRWKPVKVGYEKYGMQSDIEHMQSRMEIENYRFAITPLGGAMPKNDRIRRLVPLFEYERFFLPHRLLFIDYEKKTKDFIREFIDDEFLAFPVSAHDDMLDCMARIVEPELGAVFPEGREVQADREVFDGRVTPQHLSGHMVKQRVGGGRASSNARRVPYDPLTYNPGS